MRLFFAVPVSPLVGSLVAERIASLEIVNPPWRWIPKENYHLTLKFLGDVDAQLLPALGDAARQVAARVDPFHLAFSDFGAFPSLRRPRVIFFGIEVGWEPLQSLASSIEGAVEGLGFDRERRPFRAHLTLARIKRPLRPALIERLGSIPSLPPEAMQVVDHYVLMRSHLSRSGATYEELERYDLASTP
jgi:2'-5' RNA ligase